MPSFKIDGVYDWDFLNLTFTRTQGAPKIAPEWKGKRAPKLAPKPKALPPSSTPRPPFRPKINTSRFGDQSEEQTTPRITDVTETEEDSKLEASKSSATNSQPKPASATPKKNIPKLKSSGAPQPKSALGAGPNAANTSKSVNKTAKP